MRTVHHIFIAILFVIGLLVGMQLPNFVVHYQQTIEAHYIEASENASGFQKVADLFHNGSIEALIDKHENSIDPTFRAEAKPIRDIYLRKLRFDGERQALQVSFLQRAWHVFTAGKRDVLDEVYQQYSAAAPLNAIAIACGMIIAVLLVVVYQMLALIGRFVIHAIRDRKTAGV